MINIILLYFCVLSLLYIVGYSFHLEGRFGPKLTHIVTLGTLQAVVFDKVITNNGYGYNRHSGHFTVPRDGTYYLTTSFLSYAGDLHLQMIRNAQIIGTGVGAPYSYSSGSISATVNLKR